MLIKNAARHTFRELDLVSLDWGPEISIFVILMEVMQAPYFEKHCFEFRCLQKHKLQALAA